MNGKGQMYGAVRSPYAEYNGNAHEHEHDHDHGHERTRSSDSAFTVQTFVNGRSKGRPRGESDLARPSPRKAMASGKYGFSPIQEAGPVPPPVVST